MDQVVDFFRGIFDISRWPARWRCGQWTDFHGWLYIISDVLIFAAYFTIPILIILVARRKKLPFLPVFWLAAAFILFCGFSHLVDAIIFWYPVYKFSAIIRFCTALISLVTVFVLLRVLPRAFSLKTPEELQVEIENRKNAEVELALKNDELKLANLELDKFVYASAHDLRAPISTILGLLEFVKTETKEVDTKATVDMLLKEVDKLDYLIHEIIDFSKNKRVAVAKEEVNFKVLFQEVVKGLEQVPNYDRIKFVTNITDQTIITDRDRMKSILRSLLDNAIRYSLPEKNEGIVEVFIMIGGKTLILKIQDFGEGVPNDMKEQIFEMFFRGSNRSKGSGLGLYLVSAMVNALDGELELISQEGKGTQVELRIPVN